MARTWTVFGTPDSRSSAAPTCPFFLCPHRPCSSSGHLQQPPQRRPLPRSLRRQQQQQHLPQGMQRPPSFPPLEGAAALLPSRALVLPLAWPLQVASRCPPCPQAASPPWGQAQPQPPPPTPVPQGHLLGGPPVSQGLQPQAPPPLVGRLRSRGPRPRRLQQLLLLLLPQQLAWACPPTLMLSQS